jgi:hypothetical protein
LSDITSVAPAQITSNKRLYMTTTTTRVSPTVSFVKPFRRKLPRTPERCREKLAELGRAVQI